MDLHSSHSISKSTLDAPSLTPSSPPSSYNDTPVSNVATAPKQTRDIRFWMCFASLILPTFLMALDMTGVSTPLPVIVRDLNGKEFEWVGSAYALSATAFQPLSGGLAQVFGRRAVMLTQILIFAVGSIICGVSPTLNVLIAGRTVQGVGAGGIAALGQIILGDLVPLQERGVFNGLIVMSYGFAVAIGPLVGGALAQNDRWRWLFYMNLPICGVSAVLVATFLKLKTPHGTWREKINKIDWTGNFIVMGSTAACVIALTWGGVQAPWNAPKVIIPLVVGLLGLVAFIVFEARVPRNPLVPVSSIANRTTISGHIQTFFAMFLLISVIYYLPVYFQACKGHSTIASGVDAFGVAQTIAPFSLISGATITKSGRYRPQLWMAWLICILGAALLSTLGIGSSRAEYIGYQVIMSLGMGILMTGTVFPVLSPLSVSLNASALAFYMFIRYMSQIWGMTAGGTVLENELKRRLPSEFLSRFPNGTSVAFSLIPAIHELPEPLQTDVRVAFAESLRVFWLLLIAIGGIGLFASLFMKGLPLHTSLDENWGLENHSIVRKADLKPIV